MGWPLWPVHYSDGKGIIQNQSLRRRPSLSPLAREHLFQHLYSADQRPNMGLDWIKTLSSTENEKPLNPTEQLPVIILFSFYSLVRRQGKKETKEKNVSLNVWGESRRTVTLKMISAASVYLKRSCKQIFNTFVKFIKIRLYKRCYQIISITIW